MMWSYAFRLSFFQFITYFNVTTNIYTHMFFRFDTQEISYFVLNLEILYLFLYFLKIEKKNKPYIIKWKCSSNIFSFSGENIFPF